MKMKKLSIVLLAFLFIGISNINAQTNEVEKTTQELSLEENLKANCPDWGTDKCPFTKNDKGEIICKKTGKVCDETCLNKAKGTCCNGKKKKSCSKSKSKCSKEEKAACSKSKTKCSKGKEKSACCSKDEKAEKKSCCSKKSSGCSKSKSSDSKK